MLRPAHTEASIIALSATLVGLHLISKYYQEQKRSCREAFNKVTTVKSLFGSVLPYNELLLIDDSDLLVIYLKS